MYFYSLGNIRRKNAIRARAKKNADRESSPFGAKAMILGALTVFALTTMVSCGFSDEKLTLSKKETVKARIKAPVSEISADTNKEKVMEATLNDSSKYILSPFSKETLSEVRKKIELTKNTPEETLVYKVRKGDTLWSISKRFGMDIEKLAVDNGITVSTPLTIGRTVKIIKVPSFLEYKVEHGDSLWRIANKFGVSINEIATVNSISTEARLDRGQVIRVKTFQSAEI